MEQTELECWLAAFREGLCGLFGDRLRFFSLQGSHARGEATDASDLDVVVILDRVRFADLEAYRRLLDRTERREQICGFVAGLPELAGWERSDLLGLLLDTRPLLGSLEALCPPQGREEAWAALRIGACNLYHACSHNYLHGRSAAVLAGLYKSARFAVRIKWYARTGDYIPAMRDLEAAVPEPDRGILRLCRALPPTAEPEFDRLCRALLEWSSAQLTGAEQPEGGAS